MGRLYETLVDVVPGEYGKAAVHGNFARMSPTGSLRTRDDLAACFQMLWRRALPELSDADQMQFERLCSKDSPDFIADRPGYCAFITYTLFSGLVPSRLK